MLRYVMCDVFTDRPLAGNQLAVFPDGDQVASELTQALAREINFSETVFVIPAPGEDGDAAIRIFTPAREIPFAGHPVLGTAVVLALRSGADRIRLQTAAGVVPVTVRPTGNRAAHARMAQPTPRAVEPPDRRRLLAALGLAGSGLPVAAYDNGITHVYVACASPDVVAGLSPDMGDLARIVPDAGVSCFSGRDGTYTTRMFAPGLGVPEDPATGSAAGPLAVYLATQGRIAFGDEIRISQGEHVGRPSTLFAQVDGAPGALEAVYVGGGVVVVGEGRFHIPGS